MVEEVLCIIEENNIPLKYIYNADQTGLYHQKLPSWIYIDKANKKDLASVKRMKDKTHVTLMVCTAADGMKVPLYPIGKPEKSECFQLVGDDALPIQYKNQKTAWFDRAMTQWWINTVFWS